MIEHGERSPLLQASRDTSVRRTEKRSDYEERDSRCLSVRHRDTNNVKPRFFPCHKSWHATTLVAVLLATVTGLISFSISSVFSIDRSRVQEGDASADHRPTPPTTDVSLPRHEIRFDRDEGHDLGDLPLYGERERTTRDSVQEVQQQALGRHDAHAVEHGDGTGNAHFNPASQPGLAREGQGHNSTDDAGGGRNSSKPNVFVFLIDDMGWNDIGYQSTDLSAYSPHLDALAAEGVKVRLGGVVNCSIIKRPHSTWTLDCRQSIMIQHLRRKGSLEVSIERFAACHYDVLCPCLTNAQTKTVTNFIACFSY